MKFLFVLTLLVLVVAAFAVSIRFKLVFDKYYVAFGKCDHSFYYDNLKVHFRLDLEHSFWFNLRTIFYFL
jgi:hypothetical protein